MDIIRNALETQLAKMEADPGFAKLSFEEQLKARQIVIGSILPNDPEFSSLDPINQSRAVLTIAQSRRPVFENRDVNARMDRVFKASERGDLEASTMKAISFARGLFEQSVLANMAIRPLYKALDASIKSSDPNALTYSPTIDALTGSDGDKVVSYLRSRYLQQKEAATGKGFQTLGAIVGFIGDFGVFHGAWVKLTGGAIKAVSVGKAAKLTGTRAWAARVAFPTFVSGTSSGAYGIFREHFLAVVNKEDERRQDSFNKVLKTFGEYAVLDYALNFALGTFLPHIKLLKHFKSGKTSSSLQKFKPGELDTLITQVTEGTAPPEILNQLNDLSRSYILGQVDLRKAALNVGSDIRLRPYDDLLFKASKTNITVHYDPDSGLYKMFRPNEKTGIIEAFETPDIIKAKREVSKDLVAKYKTLTSDEAKAAFLEETDNIMQYKIVEDGLDGTFDPSKVTGKLDRRTAALLKPKGVAKNFTSPVDRPYIGTAEADLYESALQEPLKATKGFVGRFKVKATDEMLSRVKKGAMPFEGGKAVTINNGTGDTEVLVLVKYPATPEAIAKADELAAKAIANGSTESAATLRNMYLMESGFDGIVKNRNAVEMFYPDKIKFIASEFNPVTGKIGKLNILKTETSPITARATIERTFNAKLNAKAFVENKKLLIDTAATRFRGNIKLQDAEDFSKLYLSNYGVEGNKISIKLSNVADSIDADSSIKAISRIKDGKAIIEIPKEITNPKAQKEFVKEFFDELKNVADTLGDSKVIAKAGDSFSRLLTKSKAQFKVSFDNTKAQTEWIRGVVEDMKGSFAIRGDSFEVLLPKQKSITAKTLDELIDKVLVNNIDESFLKFDLSKQGYSLSRVGDTFVVRGKDLTTPVTGKDIPDVLEKLNYRPSKISNKYAPKVTMLSPDSVNVSFTNGVAVGDNGSLKRLLASFEDTNHMAKLQKVLSDKNGDIFIRPAGDIEVHMPELGLIKNFSNIGEARKFISGGWKEFDSLKRIAEHKSLVTWYEKGILKISDGKNTFSAANPTEAAKVFARYPDSTGAKEIFSDLDPESLTVIDKVLYNFDMSKIPEVDNRIIKTYKDFAPENVSKFTLRQELRTLTQQTDYWFEKTFKELKRPDILRAYRNLETANRLSQVEIDKTDKALARIFSNGKGKLPNLKRLQAIYYHMGAQSPEELEKAVEWFGELTSEEQAIANNLRKLLGTNENGVLTGLAGKFGVDPELFINNYMPRVMDYAVKNKKALNSMVTAEELFDNAYSSVHGSKAPPKIKAFFKNMRESDILAFQALDNPIKVLQLYNRIGHRQLYMGKAWEELYSLLKTGDIPASAIDKIHRYREQLMSVYTTSGAETAGRFGEIVAKKLGMQNGKELVNAYFSVNYLTNMGWRPWLAIRNTMQVWTTLAPRIGNEWVNKGIKITNELGEDGYAYLQKIGLFSKTPPLANTTADVNSFLGRLTEKGLSMFKSSDEITRAVAFNSAAARFDDAMSKFKSGVIKNTDDFLKEAGVTKMDDDTIREVKRLVNANTTESIAAARAKYGIQLSEDTMFPYRPSQSPNLYTGSFWGKLFGQYGTYATGYRANIYRGLMNGSTGDKAAFVARFLGNQTAIWAALTSLGIRANDFVPGMPAIFGGGPQWEVGVALMQSFSSDYRGKQSRAKLMRLFSPVGYTKTDGFKAQYPQMAPGNLQFRYAQKSLQYLQDGDLWRAFLAATTTPVVDEEDVPEFLR